MNKYLLSLCLLLTIGSVSAQQPIVKLVGATYTGSIFSVNPDGTEAETIADFIPPHNDGIHNRLTFAAGKLWGVASEGTALGGGCIYNLNPTTNESTIVYEFKKYSSSPYAPVHGLTYSNGKLWGVARAGSYYEYGGIYSIDTNGENLTWHHYFRFDSPRHPSSRLVEYDGKLYGTTTFGKPNGTDTWGQMNVSNGTGTVFSIDTSGDNFTIVHKFDIPFGAIPPAGTGTGRAPQGALVVSHDKLWGTTFRGGRDDNGVIFRIDLKTGEAKAIHQFSELGGGFPNGNIIEHSGQLWGLASESALGHHGFIYKIDPLTESFQVVHKFIDSGKGSPANIGGSKPIGGLTAYKGRLWG